MKLRIIYKWYEGEVYELQKYENDAWGTIGSYSSMMDAYSAFQTEGPDVPIVSLYGTSDE